MLVVTGICFAIITILHIMAMGRVKGNTLGVLVTIGMIIGSYYFTYLVGKMGVL